MHSFFQPGKITTFVNVDDFKKAISESNTHEIERMLEMKVNGAILNLEMQIKGMTPLQLLLQNKDYNNANKLIKAGAATYYEDEEWIENKEKDEDDYHGPFGTFVLVKKSYLTDGEQLEIEKINQSVRPK